MRRHHAPAFGKAYPGLHLAADLARHGGAMKQSGGDGGVAAVGSDNGLREHSCEACGGASSAEGLDLRIPEQVLAAAEPDRAGIIVEHGIERRDIVCNERAFIGLEGGLHFGDDVREVDVHVKHPWVRQPSPGGEGRTAKGGPGWGDGGWSTCGAGDVAPPSPPPGRYAADLPPPGGGGPLAGFGAATAPLFSSA